MSLQEFRDLRVGDKFYAVLGQRDGSHSRIATERVYTKKNTYQATYDGIPWHIENFTSTNAVVVAERRYSRQINWTPALIATILILLVILVGLLIQIPNISC